MMTLGELLKQARKGRGLTQSEAAASLQISQGTVSKYENDELEPGLRETLKITVIYQLSMARIFGALMKTERK